MALLGSEIIEVVALTTIRLLPISVLVYLVGLSIYRLYLSPIAGFPGPKLAALTQWYEFYYNVILPGQFYLHIETLHDKYGPIIRINPWELHVRDPDYFETVYSSTARRNKVPAHLWTGIDLGTHGTMDHDLHQLRRKALNPYFSKRQMYNFSPFIQSRADKICNRLAFDYGGSDKVLNMSQVWGCYASDNVMQYCFATNEDLLSNNDFVAPLMSALVEALDIFHYVFHFPWLMPLMKSVPESVIRFLHPRMSPVFEYQDEVRAQIIALKNGKNQAHKDVSYKTVLLEMLNSDLPPQEKTVERLLQDGVSFVTAGIETTSHVLELATFHILYKTSIFQKLRKELMEAIHDPSNPPPLIELEQLPYLTAIITEALRLSYANFFRLPRTSPDEPLHYGPWTIPAGTPISMGHYSMHNNPTLFPDPHSFIPERWLNNPKAPLLTLLSPKPTSLRSPAAAPTSAGEESLSSKPLSRYMITFSRGARQCIGMNLAYAELYIGLASVFRRVEMRLYETGLEAVEGKIDQFVPRPVKGSKGVRVRVRAVE